MTVLQYTRERGAMLRGRRHQDRPHSTCKVCMGLLIILALCRPVSMSAANGASGYANTSVASPVRSATVPLSSYQNDLVSRPNPIDSSSNRVITGNVAGGKHFRADIPYRSTTSMNAPMGSTSLDSFMRYTATAQTPTGTYSPYYSPTGTTTTTQAGTRSVLAPGTSRMGSNVAAPPILPPRLTSATHGNTLAGDTASGALPPLRLWPQSRTPGMASDGLLDRRAEPPVDRRASIQQPEVVTGDEYKRQMELLQERLAQVQAELAELERSVAPGNEKPSVAETLPPHSPLRSKEELLQETARLLATTKAPVPDQGEEEKVSPGSGATAVPKLGSGTESSLKLYDPSRQTPEHQVGTGTGQSRTRTGVSASQRAGQAARTSGAPKNPARKVDEKPDFASIRAFERHLGMAEHHFSCGQYAQAAKSFALASACLPSNARAHLGRSHALLAAGQYAGSALSLARAIELDPQLALRRSDLVRIAGGPDGFIARFNELEEAAQTGKTPQLQLLLAYIYYQMERPQEAKVAIETARNLMPSSIPADLLKAAIYQ